VTDRLAPVLMVQGTASSAGKSTLVAGLCRLFARRGLQVAPFKAQNMSNNAAVCQGGGEIGRAQFAQAEAAGVEPTVDMNPILLKPQGGASQIVVRGHVQGVQTAREYFGPKRADLRPLVADSLDRLRAQFDLVIAEGAGSPAEINLRARDIVNMQVAPHAEAEVLLVGDIDRGGAFAALLGTWEWLTPAERALVRGFVLNKFRGDAALLFPAPELLEQRTGVPVLGVVPYLDDLSLPEEDAASLEQRSGAGARVEIAVIRLPHLANFDEFGPLAAEPGVHVRYGSQEAELRAPDLVILPGTKTTIPDLLWLAERGLAHRIQWLARHGTAVLGICGGYQMLGNVVRDPDGLESDQRAAAGLCLLPIATELVPEKRLVRRHGRFLNHGLGVWNSLAALPVEGYEIHMGRSRCLEIHRPFVELDPGAGPEAEAEGSVAATIPVVGTHVHGLFEHSIARHALVQALAASRGFTWSPATPEAASSPFDVLADVLEKSLQLGSLTASCLA
jgi:adenosylcobyric acid synthase